MTNVKWFGATQAILSFAFLCLCSGCYIEVGLPGSGVASTEKRTVDEFTGIDLSGSGKVNVVCGQAQSVTVTVDDNLQEIITTEVVDGVLEIGSSQSYSSKVGLTVDISVPTLNRLEASGACNATIENCETEKLLLDVSGAGKLAVSGTVANVELDLSGAGSVDLSNLSAKKAKIDMSGAAKATVNASDELDVAISGVGKVSYLGDPVVKQQLSGLGKVVQIGKSPDTSKDAAETSESDRDP
jgi:hypothetical protein